MQHPVNVGSCVSSAEEFQGGGSECATSRAPLHWHRWCAQVISRDLPSCVTLEDWAGWKGATEVPREVEQSWNVYSNS